MGTSSGDGRTLRALREASGVSLGQIVRLTDYSKGHLSKVENGLRPASTRLMRVYESLCERPGPVVAPRPTRHTPEAECPVAAGYGGEIRRARNAVGLSQRDLAKAAGLSHVYVSKLENGHSLGTKYVAGRLDKELGQSGALVRLFAAESGRPTDPVTVPSVSLLSRIGCSRPPMPVNVVVVEAAAELERLRTQRHLVGPAAVVNDVVAQLVALHSAARTASAGRALAYRRVEARYAEYLSWLAEELGDAQAMHEWLALAVCLGSDSGDTAIAAYAAIRQSATALRADDPRSALHHVQFALSDPALPTRLRRIALQRESRARARSGDREGFRRAMDAFYDVSDDVSSPSAEDWEWGPAWDPELSSSRLTEASGLLELEEFRRAADMFATTMPSTFPNDREPNPAFRHARVCFAIREATAYAHVHECDRAADVIESFLPAVPNGSITIQRDLRRLVSILSRRRAARLRALAPDIITLARTARPRPPATRLETLDARP
ncbi:MAG TPA: helix-turn-helix domain-containing protein [Actinospica sp.]|jgi:transcriptional regulator with XRE-family HTH domain|nr:helix-turn-helix domain-containing protein [Actinospica sp.]